MRYEYNIPTTEFKMSAYNHSHKRQDSYWRQRDAQREAERKAAEEEQKRKTLFNSTNFPTLTDVRQQETVKGNEYAQLARKWAVDTEVDRRIEEHKKFREASDKIEVMHRRSHSTRYERHDEDYEEEMEDQPKAARSFLDDDVGWSEVKGRSYKGPRDRSVEEMDRMAQEKQEQEETDFNGHLFESNRHDHHKV